jgi:predicted nucleic acid-binding protein
MIVIADTTPVNYLVLIDRVEILPQLYGRVLIPVAVWEELQRPETPEALRVWVGQPPAWLEIRHGKNDPDPAIQNLGAGELEAMALAEELHADRLIMDDRVARRDTAESDCNRHPWSFGRSRRTRADRFFGCDCAAAAD